MGERYDFIVAGAGAAGLSLVYHLAQAGVEGRVLLLERAPKTENDRTWCFWEVEAGPFEPLVFRRWEHLWFFGEDQGQRLSIAPYTYKMIRGRDFYAHMERWMSTQPQLTLRYGEVTRIGEDEEGPWVEQGGRVYRGQWVFSSLYQPPPPSPRYHRLLQHFKGWVVRASRPVFDPQAATLMDFRLPQRGPVCFGYVLPFDAQTALVEYTLFSQRLLPPEAYDQGLKEYLEGVLGVERYEVLEREFGVIPMTDAPLPQQPSPRVVHIGTAGGCTKASTGYTFQRIQAQARRIAQTLQERGRPVLEPGSIRHALMDSVLLHLLERGYSSGERVFSRLFRKNPPQRVLRFLDEATGWLEDLQVMASVDVPVFARAALGALWRRWGVGLWG
ncbi:MAG: lycopene cyclase family protein [Meiothermus sp.]|uniref:lycopene cyclase family protein n=1 Tax=Meiothermus sp. TaxID=1955249 RepID=UPI0025F83810|nr:lycopene cyclase family protein [Meiothermus sp.]MCS7057397.1 lycopene cyclase family protein [Meiothermus sp.]MCS7193599.1 lycopene cyclase family protein [Meiothermus sp.]MCX7740365.1 lycopene cyclase family protein [Meiothermus sp.]MDW8090612.1 lycopene cyclase family protein [Meiothermus sp.]MDW8480528.1 lycopene cyclase family protein [Meiothermus sp.]